MRLLQSRDQHITAADDCSLLAAFPRRQRSCVFAAEVAAATTSRVTQLGCSRQRISSEKFSGHYAGPLSRHIAVLAAPAHGMPRRRLLHSQICRMDVSCTTYARLDAWRMVYAPAQAAMSCSCMRGVACFSFCCAPAAPWGRGEHGQAFWVPLLRPRPVVVTGPARQGPNAAALLLAWYRLYAGTGRR